jgi:hypothetical protein
MYPKVLEVVGDQLRRRGPRMSTLGHCCIPNEASPGSVVTNHEAAARNFSKVENRPASGLGRK